ncbi:Uncharacterized protein C26F1.08c [Hypsizygus marmoreus]|uniref:Uncharacterized protein C26F1.08c n=1 Tax=Hypsizygus marmoreus TaxID=39966 RepID=A0A369JQT9_HYPMA|nr:Uncharacterized protein C26F1.08c [Hypsizygus marmoreus]
MFQILWNFFSSRRVLARLLSTILCSIFVVLRPFSKFGGPSAYLALTVKELGFSVQDNLAQQLEAIVLHLAGGFTSIGLSVLGMYLASLAHASGKSVIARLIPALFLAVICFTAGWLKSRLPRLTLTSRIVCFTAIWLLTTDAGGTQHIWKQASQFLWVILTAAITTLFSSMILLRWSSTQFARDVAACFSKLHACLLHHLGEAFSEIQPTVLNDNIHKELLRRSVALNPVYQQAAFELRIGRLSVKSLKPFIGTIEHLRQELSWGMSFPQQSQLTGHETDVIKAFYHPALELGCALLDSIKAMEQIIIACFDRSLPPARTRLQKQDLLAAKTRLTAAWIAAREELRTACDNWEAQQRSADQEERIETPSKIFELCSFMISLLQMAHDVRNALNATEAILALHTTSSLRLWHPRLSLAWLGVTPSTVILEERGVFVGEAIHEPATTLSQDEALQGIAETSESLPPRVLEKSLRKQQGPVFSAGWFHSVAYHVWNNSRTLRGRLVLSGYLRSVEHSPHLRHAFKNAAGISILSIPAFLPIDSPGYNWFKTYYGQWMLTSFLWVLETNTGATWRVAYLRLTGTILGALYAYIASLICQTNPYALVVMASFADLPISYIVTNTSFPSLGVVTAITLPPILFAAYFGNNITLSSGMIAVFRGAMIMAGIVAALLMNSLLFPRHCRVLFLDSTCNILSLFSKLYMGLSRDLFHRSQTSSAIAKHKSIRLEIDIRQLLHRSTILITTMDDELSLIPKPMRCYRNTVAVLQRLLDLLTGIRKIRENIPRKETVEAVVPQRREMMSCVCISFFACEQAFRSRQPLPQFLPSSREALHTLERDMEHRISLSRRETTASLGLPIIYAFAEINILRDLVDTIEELLHLTRQLFGTSSWFSPTSLDSAIVLTLHEEPGAITQL